ncbi:MAG: hypothetical protein K8T91_14820 [Planctomycetes bacterium]|nr:hypothetical protein [Planctomycetota bacterium]
MPVSPVPLSLHHRAVLTLFAATSCCLLMGCGTDEYQKLTDQKLSYLRHESPYRSLWPEPIKDFPNAALSLRIPRGFGAGTSYAFDASSPEPKAKTIDALDPHRVQPYFLRLPGLQRTYEGFVKVESRQLPGDMITKPLYLYIALTSTRDRKNHQITGGEVEKILRDKLVARFDKKVSPWETVELPTIDGPSATWKRLEATGDQDFFAYEENYPKPKVYPGVYLLYLRTMADYHVLLGWRCGEDVAKAIDLKSIADLTAGTVKVGE